MTQALGLLVVIFFILGFLNLGMSLAILLPGEQANGPRE